MRHAVVVLAILAVLVGIVEAGVRPVLATAAARAVPCAEQVAVTAVGRPATIGLLRGEIHDVRLELEGVDTATLRLDRVVVGAPSIRLFGIDGEPTELDIAVTITAADLEWFVAERVPALLRPTLDVVPSGVVLSDERLPLALELAVSAVDGALRFTPRVDGADRWSGLGIDVVLALPRGLEVQSVTPRDGALVVEARASVPHPAAIAALCR
jgi:hypothetical protein